MVTGDEAEAVLDLLFDISGVVTHGLHNELRITVTVTATSCKAAIEQATARLDDACDVADLRARKIVGVQAVEWTRTEVPLEQSAAPVQAPDRT